MISLACGKLTGMAGCCGSNCSPMSMREELPREITKEAKVTGTPLADSLFGRPLLGATVKPKLGLSGKTLVMFTSDKLKMGSFANPTWLKILAWAVASVIASLNIWLLVQTFRAGAIF